MSIFSDYKVGAIDEREFEQEGRRMNREDRRYIDDFERLAEEGAEDEDSDRDANCP